MNNFEKTLSILTEATSPVEKLAKKIAKLTDENDHTGSWIALAKHLGEDELVDKLKDLKARHNKAGHLTDELSTEKEKLKKKVLAVAKKELSPADFKLVKSSF